MRVENINLTNKKLQVMRVKLAGSIYFAISTSKGGVGGGVVANAGEVGAISGVEGGGSWVLVGVGSLNGCVMVP